MTQPTFTLLRPAHAFLSFTIAAVFAVGVAAPVAWSQLDVSDGDLLDDTEALLRARGRLPTSMS